MIQVFVDTGFWYALAEPKDQHHKQAAWLVATPHRWWTSDLVVNETMTLWQRRGHLDTALAFLQQVQKQESGQIVFTAAGLTTSGWDEFKTHGRFGATPVDSISFAIMRSLGINTVFGFDHHFQQAGFHLLATIESKQPSDR
jgi:predicted nucleic acid-binding protein